MGDPGSIPELGQSPGEGKGYPLQYSGLENSTDCKVHGVAESWTRLSDFHFPSLQSFTLYSNFLGFYLMPFSVPGFYPRFHIAFNLPVS